MKTKLICIALAAAALAATALCQEDPGQAGGPPGGQQGPGGFGGPGGPGGPGGFRGPGGPGQMGPRMPMGPAILLIPAVQRELKLTDDQIEKIKQLIPARPMGGPGMGPRGGQGRPGGPPQGFSGNDQGGPPPPPDQEGGQNGPPPGQGSEGGPPPDGQGGPPMEGGQGGPPMQGGPGGRRPMGGPMGQGNGNGRRMEARLRKILNADQMKRYREIDLQLQGAHALMRPEVSARLDLSDDQLDKLDEVFQANRPQRPQQGGDPDAMRKQMETRRAEVNRKALDVLTAAQRDRWKDMLGKPFDLPKPPPRRDNG